MISTSCIVILLLAAQIPASETLTSAGKEFTVVFPENIAYFHPMAAQNKIWITALLPNTNVTISSSSSQDVGNKKLSAGETWMFKTTQELGKLDIPEAQDSTPFQNFSISNKTIKITSIKDVVVQAISSRRRSQQSALIVPKSDTAQKYFIPPVPQTEGASNDGDPVVNVTERGPFRLIIINPGAETASVTIEGNENVVDKIEPGQVAQIWVKDSETPLFVEATKPVAVYFSHPCAMHECTCRLLHAMLPPSKNNTTAFPIPPVLGREATILLSDERSRSRKSFNPASAVVHSAGTAILYKPGLLLTLISVEEFGSCFAAPFIEDVENFLIIVVHKNQKEGIHIGEDPLKDVEWQTLSGTDYVSTNFSVSSHKTFVWHSSSTMAAYFIGEKNNTWFGNPAPVVSTTPDYRGCTLTPEVIEILDEEKTWKKSIKSCVDKDLTLISLSKKDLQKQICRNLRGKEKGQVWIGTRRSSLTGDWYWLDDKPFNETNWARGEPGEVDEGQCAVMSLKSDSECGWEDKDCCKETRPLCYRDPKLLNIA